MNKDHGGIKDIYAWIHVHAETYESIQIKHK